MRQKNRIGLWVVTIFSVVVLSGCSMMSGKSSLMPPPSGFLSSYQKMTPHKNVKGLFDYRSPTRDVSQYHKYMIAPVQMYFHPEARAEDKLKKKDEEKLTEHFHDFLTEELKTQGYEITNQPGPDVLLIRTAITDVVPNKIYFNLHWSTVLTGLGIGGASFEAEFIDSVSQEQVLAVVASQKGNRMKYFRGLTKWGHTNEALKGWAQFLTDSLQDSYVQ